MATNPRPKKSAPSPRRMAALGWLAIWVVMACGTQSPSLLFSEGVPGDLRELGREVWGEFLAVFPDRAGCIGQVTLVGDWALEGSRAYYLPEGARVVLAIPGTAARLRHSLVHELAHHVEHACADHAELRAAFLDAQGLAPDTPWFGGPSWEETPSEQYAEAVVRLVLSRPVIFYRLDLAREAVEAVREWGGGG